jgi:mono/diheme cytochrome c family protein
LRIAPFIARHATRLRFGKVSMHRTTSTFGIWRHRFSAFGWGASLWAVILSTGCSSTSKSAPTESVSAPTDSFSADPQVDETFANSCSDCHSNRGSGPWNAKIAPSYLFGANKARADLNFSDWPTLDVKQRRAMASAIAAAVDSGSMPPGDYEFFHPSAKLSDEQKKLVLQWASGQMVRPAH